MALQKTLYFKGLTIDDSYTIVTNYRYDKINESIHFTYSIYANSGSRANNIFDFLEQKQNNFQPSGSYNIEENVVVDACYNFLKTLPEWSGSVDV